MKTVAHKNIENWWDGKVIIDEVREYADSRGALTELWRTDDEVMASDKQHCPTMSYWSITKPYVMRGPHQHTNQTDWFYTFKNKMVYQMYNPETKEMKIHFTNPNAITRVKVAPPIIHSYRSLETRDITTANFPSALFMGENKKSPIDEVRWEDKFEHNPVIFIFGANGRLGKNLTKAFCNNMEFHAFDIVPCYEKVNNLAELQVLVEKLESLFKNRNLYFFNCAAITNVQDTKTLFDAWEWTNAIMPTHFANYCNSNGWKFIGFSTDYIYQDDAQNGNSYIRSKKAFERSIANHQGSVSILRVANLFSLEEDDVHNVIVKFKRKIEAQGDVTVDPRLSVFPTNVEQLSNKIVSMFKSGTHFTHESIKYYNIVPKKYKLEEFVSTFFPKANISFSPSNIAPWDDKFEAGDNSEIIKLENCDTFIAEIASR